ncbi:hypothetical protein XENTR_v10009456 [Xenopus tropicalis]|nr:hypothetical protein XENTR_v10009456 [Xenopus tropicalis]
MVLICLRGGRSSSFSLGSGTVRLLALCLIAKQKLMTISMYFNGVWAEKYMDCWFFLLPFIYKIHNILLVKN